MIPFLLERNLEFIHAGANDGITGDWLHSAIVDKQWKGICLEPQAKVFEKLCETYRGQHTVFPLRAALSNRNGQQRLYRFFHPDARVQKLCDPLASFDRELLIRNAMIEMEKVPGILADFLTRPIDEFVEVETVSCWDLSSLMDHYQVIPDLISLDIEGHEAAVLLEVDLATVRPKYFFFEIFHMPEQQKHQVLGKLQSNGYRISWVPEFNLPQFNALATLS